MVYIEEWSIWQFAQFALNGDYNIFAYNISCSIRPCIINADIFVTTPLSFLSLPP